MGFPHMTQLEDLNLYGNPLAWKHKKQRDAVLPVLNGLGALRCLWLTKDAVFGPR